MGEKVEVKVMITGVTKPSACVDEEEVTMILGGGVLRVGSMSVGVIEVATVGVSDTVCVQELPQRVMTWEEVTGTVIVTVSTTVDVPPTRTCQSRQLSCIHWMAYLEFVRRSQWGPDYKSRL